VSRWALPARRTLALSGAWARTSWPGHLWKAESLWAAGVSPWRALADCGDEELLAVLEAAAGLMRTSVDTGREARSIYGKAGRPCPRCGKAIRARGQGDDNRTAYWCPACQHQGPVQKVDQGA